MQHSESDSLPPAKLQGHLNIALIDDHVLLRNALREAIGAWPHGEVVLEAENGLGYENACASGPPIHLVIVDLGMPVRDGYETIEWIVENQPEVRIMAITHEPNEEKAYRAMEAGAHTIVGKAIDPVGLRGALDDMRLTGFHVNTWVQKQITHKPDAGSPIALRKKARRELSDQQLRFLLIYIGDDHPTIVETGKRIGVNECTAESYRSEIVRKLGISRRTELYEFALRFGLINSK